VKEAGGARTLVVKRLKIKTADPQLTLSFVPSKGDTVLSGVEIVAEK
jgi:hypothetical protein